jgi:hypothetical protein
MSIPTLRNCDHQRALAQNVIVPQCVLRELAKGDPLRALGEISTADQAILAAYLPDMCEELLSLRAQVSESGAAA